MSINRVPCFPGAIKKNDALFMYGATQAQPFVFTYEPACIEVVHGPSCHVSSEVFIDNCTSDNVPVTLRRTGGGTVVLSPGTVVTVVTGERTGTHGASHYFDIVHDAMIALLRELGITDILKTGISDLSIHGRKILGSSLYLGTTPRLYYYQSSMLVAPDLSLFERYLRHPPREPEYRNCRTHADFCTSLARQGYSISANKLSSIFSGKLQMSIKQRQ